MALLFGKSKKSKPTEVKVIYKPKNALKQKQPSLENAKDIINTKCPCCGTNVAVAKDLSKFKCGICRVTTLLKPTEKALNEDKENELICCVDYLQSVIQGCFEKVKSQNLTDKNEKYNALEPICRYVSDCFHSSDVLERSFIPKSKKRSELIDYKELDKFYHILMKLPTRRPFYRMLCACNDLLKKPRDGNGKIRWLSIIWENPFVRYCLTTKLNSKFDSPEIKAVAYELTKRCVGYMSNISGTEKYSEYMHCLKYMDTDIFLSHIEIINLYITYQLTRIMYHAIRKNVPINKRKDNNLMNVNQATSFSNIEENNRLNLNEYIHLDNNNDNLSPMSDIPAEDLWNDPSETVKAIELDRKGNSLQPKGFKFKPSQYEHDWHLRSACKLMLIYTLANSKRGGNNVNLNYHQNHQINSCRFYNTMLDFLDNKQDFDVWRGMDVGNRMTHLLTEWSTSHNKNNNKRFSFCKYPFLLSLGVKISIMEYETRRIMEYQAEKAFLSSLDKGKVVEVYFKLRVRRDHITQDSLLSIKQHQGDLLKSLRIEFVNEPGIDAGGLRKEWFMLLTKSLFNPTTGLFSYIKESRRCWFTIADVSENDPSQLQSQEEHYYLFGVLIALAIFNGNILDLSFPRALYKKMCQETLIFEDYMELYPETAKNLVKMLEYSNDDFADVFGLTFETSYKSYKKGLGKNLSHTDTRTIELCHNGSDIPVTQENKTEYVNAWVDFYLSKSIAPQFERFMDGFNRVFSICNSIFLFNSEELERLLCGDEEQVKYDFQMLRSVTKYQAGFDNDTPIVNWFWEILQDWNYNLQGKLLQFVTSSNRVPATGISTLSFKISRLGARDSDALPIAHTCFNELCLWEYSSKLKLEQKLRVAITESEGFGFR